MVDYVSAVQALRRIVWMDILIYGTKIAFSSWGWRRELAGTRIAHNSEWRLAISLIVVGRYVIIFQVNGSFLMTWIAVIDCWAAIGALFGLIEVVELGRTAIGQASVSVYVNLEAGLVIILIKAWMIFGVGVACALIFCHAWPVDGVE